MPGRRLPAFTVTLLVTKVSENCASIADADSVARQFGLKSVRPASSQPVRRVPGAFL